MKGLSPTREARAQLVLDLVEQKGSLVLRSGKEEAWIWSDRYGLSLSQRDRAVNDLAEAGRVWLGLEFRKVVVNLGSDPVGASVEETEGALV